MVLEDLRRFETKVWRPELFRREAGFIGPAGSRIEAVTRRGGVLSTEGMQSSSLRWRRLRARQALRSNFAKFLMPS